MFRILIVTLVLGALICPHALGADAPDTKPRPEPDPINIVSANLKRGLTSNDIAQVKTHVVYWVGELARAKGSADVYYSRDGILADYGKYGASIRYQGEFARSTSEAVIAAMGKLSTSDRLMSLKEVNFAFVISKMMRLPAADAMSAMSQHKNPGVRFLAWQGLRGLRDDAIRAGGAYAQTLQTALKKSAAAELNPLVAAVVVDVLRIEESALTTSAFKKAFEDNFKTILVMLKTACDRLVAGQTEWTRTCEASIPILKDAAKFYKPDTKVTATVLQQLINMAQAAAKAYAAEGGVGPKAFQCIPLLLQVDLKIQLRIKMG